MTVARAVSPSADAFPRIVPLRPTEAMPGQPPPHLQCPLYRPDSSSFAASLRELEKVTGRGMAVAAAGRERLWVQALVLGTDPPFYTAGRIRLGLD